MSGARFETRVRLWKWELQKLADRTGLMITVCHMPSRRSKWNKIEHRLFSFITQNWRGKPLESHAARRRTTSGTLTSPPSDGGALLGADHSGGHLLPGTRDPTSEGGAAYDHHGSEGRVRLGLPELVPSAWNWSATGRGGGARQHRDRRALHPLDEVECTRRLIVPFRMAAMRNELGY
jgi:hypothetical protein